jgi:hypothetical protein
MISSFVDTDLFNPFFRIAIEEDNLEGEIHNMFEDFYSSDNETSSVYLLYNFYF